MPASTRSSRERTEALPWITVLAGGIGSRFWPVSTPARPKQLLALGSDRPLIVDAVERALALSDGDRVRILTSAPLQAPFARVLPSLGPEAYWLEPLSRGTGPALAWAAWRMLREDPHAVMVSLHADHVIRPLETFARLVADAVQLAREWGVLVTVGAPPSRPDPGFGYIQPGAPLETTGGSEAYRVEAFHEKPTPALAADYLGRGYLWNTGIFVWTARTFLEEIGIHAPEIARALPLLEEDGPAAFFETVPTISVDVAVLERSSRVAVARADFEWDDVGSWEAVARSRPSDPLGNVAAGEAYVVDSSRNVVFAEGGPVVLFGVEDLVVVRTGRVTMVTTRERSPDLKDLLARLPEPLRRLDEGGGS